MQPHHSPPPGEPPDPDDHHAKKLRLMDVSPPSPERRRRPSASLPSIHHLHPDLPPPNSTYQQHQRVEPRPPPRQFEPPQPSRIQPQPQQLSPPAGFMSSGPAPLTTPLAIVEEARRFAAERPSAAGPQAGQSAASSSSIPEKSLSTAGDSDQDEMVLDQTGPPKKKRRRQALSCTECKRRKIKCDRAHPCGPCQRRGEEDRCQWHVVEPVEKYVTRSEFDEVRGRCRTLEDRCSRMESLLMEIHSNIVRPGAGHSVTSPTDASTTTMEAHPSGLPTSPLLTRPLAATSRNVTSSNVDHHSSSYTYPTDQLSPKTQQSTASPSLGSGEGEVRLPIRNSAGGAAAAARDSASVSPTRPPRHVTTSQQQPPTPRATHPQPSSYHYQHSQQHQQQRLEQPTHHRPPINSNPSYGSNSSSSNRAGHDVRTHRGGEPLSPPAHLPSMTDRRTSLPFFPPPPTHGAASPSSSFLPPPLRPPDAESSHRQVSSLSPPTLPQTRATPTPTQHAAAQPQSRRHVLPPLSPSIRTRSFSQSSAAPPPLVSPSAATSTTSFLGLRGTTPSLPSPPKTSGSLTGSAGGARGLGTSGGGESRPLPFSPSLPPLGEDAYRFPPPPRSAHGTQDPFETARFRRDSITSAAGLRDRAQSVSRAVHVDATFDITSTTSQRAISPSFSFPSQQAAPPQRPPSSNERPSPSQGHSHSRSHPQLSSRTVHQLHHHPKNFLAQTLRAAAEDRLRLDPTSFHSSTSADQKYEPRTLARTFFTPPGTPDLERYAARRCKVEGVDVDAFAGVSPSRPSSSPSPLATRAARTSTSPSSNVRVPIVRDVAVASPAPVLSPVQLLAPVY